MSVYNFPIKINFFFLKNLVRSTVFTVNKHDKIVKIIFHSFISFHFILSISFHQLINQSIQLNQSINQLTLLEHIYIYIYIYIYRGHLPACLPAWQIYSTKYKYILILNSHSISFFFFFLVWLAGIWITHITVSHHHSLPPLITSTLFPQSSSNPSPATAPR